MIELHLISIDHPQRAGTTGTRLPRASLLSELGKLIRLAKNVFWQANLCILYYSLQGGILLGNAIQVWPAGWGVNLLGALIQLAKDDVLFYGKWSFYHSAKEDYPSERCTQLPDSKGPSSAMWTILLQPLRGTDLIGVKLYHLMKPPQAQRSNTSHARWGILLGSLVQVVALQHWENLLHGWLSLPAVRVPNQHGWYLLRISWYKQQQITKYIWHSEILETNIDSHELITLSCSQLRMCEKLQNAWKHHHADILLPSELQKLDLVVNHSLTEHMTWLILNQLNRVRENPKDRFSLGMLHFTITFLQCGCNAKPMQGKITPSSTQA